MIVATVLGMWFYYEEATICEGKRDAFFYFRSYSNFFCEHNDFAEKVGKIEQHTIFAALIFRCCLLPQESHKKRVCYAACAYLYESACPDFILKTWL